MPAAPAAASLGLILPEDAVYRLEREAALAGRELTDHLLSLLAAEVAGTPAENDPEPRAERRRAG